MTTYREDQGRLARMAVFWSLTLMLLFGCNFIHITMMQYAGDVMKTPVGGLSIPIVGIGLSPSFLISFVLFVGGVIAIHRWQSKPKITDFLIDTESELRKVTWPTLAEVMNSSFIVVVFVAGLMGFLALSDWLLARIFRNLILGG
jgi:preprotein translocase SecE subunit